jgi:hypothetical protein
MMSKQRNNRYSADHPFVVATYEMRARGMSVNEIADAIGLNKGQVWRFLQTPAYDPANKDKPLPSSAVMNSKAATVRVQGLSIKADDGRPLDMHSVTAKKRDGGTLFVITVFAPAPIE